MWVLVGVALTLRVGRLGSDVWADEAWYFHLAKTWGAQGRLVHPPDDIGAQIAYRPLFFVIHWPLAQLGLNAARLGNMVLSTGLVLATFRLGLRLGLATPLAFVAALVVAANPTCAHFGVVLTTDTTTALFLVLAMMAASAGSYGRAAALMSAAVLCKESSVVVAAGLLAGCILEQRYGARTGSTTSVRSRLVWWLAAPVALVVATQAVGRIAFHGRMPGWGNNLDLSTFVNNAMAGYVAVPAAVVLALRRRWVVLFAAGSLPAFYIAWVVVLRRGVVDWYAVSLLPLVVVAHAKALSDLLDWITSRQPLSPHVAGLCAVGAMTLITPWGRWWPFMHWPWLGPTLEGQQDVARALARDRPLTVGLVSCFWSLAHFPFRPSGASAWKHYPGEEGWTASELRRVRSQMREMDAIVYCPPAAAKARKAAYAADCVMFENDRYLVQKGPRRCGSGERHSKKAGPRRRQAQASDQAPLPREQAGPKASHELGASELKLDACAALQENGVVKVPGCRGPFIVFGPYLSLPAGTDVEISFEVHAETELTVFADVVSDAGQGRHGALLPEVVSAGEAQRFNYRLRLTRSTESLETRIGLDGEQAATFELRELKVRTWLPSEPFKAPPEPSAKNR